MITRELKDELQQLSERVGLSSLQLARSLFIYGLEECKSKLASGYDILLEPQPVSKLLKIRYQKNGEKMRK